MATASDRKIVDVTTCPICLEELTVPKYLPCLHTFCQDCLETYVSSKFEKGNTQNIECPVCEQTVNVPKEIDSASEFAKRFPVNFIINGLIDKEKIIGSEKQCMVCERMEIRSDATSVCVECKDLLCHTCRKHHRASKSSSDHEIRPLNDDVKETTSIKISRSMCNEHKTKEIEVYCVDHDEPCCNTCVSIHHRKCEKVISLEDAAKGCKKSNKVKDIKGRLKCLQADIENIISDRQNTQKSVETQSKGLHDEIDKAYDNLISEINTMKAKRKSELNKMSDEAKDRIQTTLTIFENQKRNVENNHTILNSCIEKASEVQLMIEMTNLKRRLKEHESMVKKHSTDIFEYKFVLPERNTVDSLNKQISSVCQPMIEQSNHSLILTCLKYEDVDLPKGTKIDKSKLFTMHRFTSTQKFEWTITGETDAICFHVSKDIELHGILSYSCKNGSSTFKAKVTLKDGQADLVVVQKTLKSRSENDLLKIMFPKPVKLTAYTPYHILAVMEGSNCNAGDKGRDVVNSGTVIFSFENSKFCTNGTCIGGGQIPGFLFKLL